jgi:hypothetical protein
MILLLLIGALLINTVPAPSPCIDCSSCVTCKSRSPKDDNSDYITIQTDDCKATPISWVCCRGSSGGSSSNCNLETCNTPLEGIELDKNKCNTVSSLQYSVPIDATSITIQLHDGRFQGNIQCENNQDCCGGSNSACASSGVGEVTINLSDCPEESHPEPECKNNELGQTTNCTAFDGECTRGICVDGKCQQLFLTGMVCRPAVKGPDGTTCDVEEVCAAGQAFCPNDDYLLANTVCRDAVIGQDGKTCDAPEVCTGNSNYCPVDVFLPASAVCRPNADLCDVPENCNGVSAACPVDVRNDFAYTYKCSTTQFLCAVTRNQITLGSGNGYFFGTNPNTCGIGTARAFVDLQWPDCVHQCINSVCPNNRDLSNYAEGHCIPSTGEWACDTKVNIDVDTVLPHCRFPN